MIIKGTISLIDSDVFMSFDCSCGADIDVTGWGQHIIECDTCGNKYKVQPELIAMEYRNDTL